MVKIIELVQIMGCFVLQNDCYVSAQESLCKSVVRLGCYEHH